MELWDAYNEDETLAGVDLIRGEKIPKGLRHGVVEVFVMHKDGTVLVMQRSFEKPNYPGFYEASAGGSVLKGEQFDAAAVRELEEETGIKATDIRQVYREMNHDTIYRGYVCVTDINKSEVRLQEGETIAYSWLTFEEFKKVFEDDTYVTSLRKRQRKLVEEMDK